jgi:hypothetical protein
MLPQHRGDFPPDIDRPQPDLADGELRNVIRHRDKNLLDEKRENAA